MQLEGVAPAEGGEAVEVGVAGVDIGLVFDGLGASIHSAVHPHPYSMRATR